MYRSSEERMSGAVVFVSLWHRSRRTFVYPDDFVAERIGWRHGLQRVQVRSLWNLKSNWT